MSLVPHRVTLKKFSQNGAYYHLNWIELINIYQITILANRARYKRWFEYEHTESILFVMSYLLKGTSQMIMTRYQDDSNQEMSAS